MGRQKTIIFKDGERALIDAKERASNNNRIDLANTIEVGLSELRELKRKLAELKTAQQWIPVSERPKGEQAVILLYPGGHREFYIWGVRGDPFTNSEDYDDPIYYFPVNLPLPPTEEKE